MEKVKVNNKEYTIIKQYPNFTLVEDKNGIRTCFDDFDLGKIEKRYIEREARPYQR